MNISDLQDFADQIDAAASPEALFGERPESVGTIFRRLAASVHPDRYPDAAAKELATEAFRRLGELHREAEERVRLGVFGTKAATPTPKPAFTPITIKAGRRTFTAEKLRCTGDVCDIYDGTADGAAVVLKVAQHPSNNDLVENEAAVLTALGAKAKGHNHARYLPELVASIAIRSAATKNIRRVNVLPLYAEHVSLAQVITDFPGYIDFRDAAWMIKRMLEGLGFVHRQGFIHGAVLPEHVLVHPLEHGAKLIGWGCAAIVGKQHVRAISSDYRNWYPQEILAKKPASAASDIYMWARTAMALVGHTAPPKRFSAFLEGCLVPAASRRPSDAWALRDELSELLQKLVGPPTYRPFTMPKNEK